MKVVLAGACRTALGSMGGALSGVPAQTLGSIVIKEALKRANMNPELVDQVYMGCVLQAGLGQNVARQAAMAAGIPNKTPAVTINVVCGSGLEAVNMAARLIACGEADIVVAGGAENMSNAPYLLKQGRYGYRLGDGKLVDSMVHDALTDSFNNYHMGFTAENIAEKWNITRNEMDVFAANSQSKAKFAQTNNKFDDEIVPVEIKEKKETIIFDKDEGIRENVTVEGLSKLRAAFKSDGSVTAGNSSTINDGAAAVVVMSEAKAKELGVKPLATWLAGSLAGVDPTVMGIGPVLSTKKVLKRLSLTINDLDLIEANEAFAVQALAVGKDLGIDANKLNVNGGSISLGHPVGASGCRILVTLLYEMQRRKANKGLATLCIGGGMGCSTIIERYCE